jgi:hypothetical protein
MDEENLPPRSRKISISQMDQTQLKNQLKHYHSLKLSLPLYSFEEYKKETHSEVLEEIQTDIGNIKQLSKIHRFILCFLPVLNYEVSHSLLLSICNHFSELLSKNTIPIIIHKYDDDDFVEIIYKLQHPMASHLISLNIDENILKILGLTDEKGTNVTGGPFRTIMKVNNDLKKKDRVMKKFGIFIIEDERIVHKIQSNEDLISSQFGVLVQDLVVKVTNPQFFILNMKSLFLEIEFSELKEIENEFKKNLFNQETKETEFDWFLKNSRKFLFFKSFNIKYEKIYFLYLFEEIKIFKSICIDCKRSVDAKFIFNNYLSPETSLFPELTDELIKKFQYDKLEKVVLDLSPGKKPISFNQRDFTEKKKYLPEMRKLEIKNLKELFEFQNHSAKDFSTSMNLFDEILVFLKEKLKEIYTKRFLNSLEFQVMMDFTKNEKKFVQRVDYVYNDDTLNYDDLNTVHLCDSYCELFEKSKSIFSPRLHVQNTPRGNNE